MLLPWWPAVPKRPRTRPGIPVVATAARQDRGTKSCLADGVQLGSGCTLGKGNIEIVKSDVVYTEFSSDGAKIRLTPLALKQLPQDTPDYELEIEKYAADLYTLPDDQLFSVEVLS